MWKLFTIILSVVIAVQSAAIIDSHTKCKLSDGACWTKFFNGVTTEASENGLPEFDIPRIDPYVLHNIDVPVLGLVNFRIVDGQTIGAKSCRFESFNFNIEEKSLTVDGYCEKVTVEGDYVISSTPALASLLGKIDIHGNGKGTCVIDKFKSKLEFFYVIEKGDDGEDYYKPLPDMTTYSYKVGKLAIDGGDVYIGKQEISKLFASIVNENWETVVKLVGNNFFDRILEEIFGLALKIFKKVPVNKLTLAE